MGFRVQVDDFKPVTDGIVTDADRAASGAMDAVQLGLKSDLRAQVSAAGLGSRLALTWQGRRYPLGRDSINSVAFVWSKAPKLIDAFDRGATIRSANGFFLAIPTEAAGPRGTGLSGKSVRITPAAWERRTGLKLRFIYRSGRPSLLVADDVRLGKSGLARPSVRSRGGAMRVEGRATVAIFILVPQVTLAKRLDIAGAADDWSGRVASLLAQNWK